MKARVFSAYIRDVDKNPVLFPHSWCHDKPTTLFRPAPTFWGEKVPFGTVSGEFASPAGVGCTPFPSLSLETFSRARFIPFHTHRVEAPKDHDSTSNIAYPGSGPGVRTVRMITLPLVTQLDPEGRTARPLTRSRTRIPGVSRVLVVEVEALTENPRCLRSTRTRSRACGHTKGRGRRSPRSVRPESMGSWPFGTSER